MKQLYTFDTYLGNGTLIEVFDVVKETAKQYTVHNVSSWAWERRVLKSDMRVGKETLYATELAAALAARNFCTRRINAAQRRIDEAAARRTLFDERVEQLMENADEAT